MFYKLHYFKSECLCGLDFRNEEQIDTININSISSCSDLLKFNMSLSGTFVGKYAVVTMNNGDKYYINEKSLSDLTVALDKYKQ